MRRLYYSLVLLIGSIGSICTAAVLQCSTSRNHSCSASSAGCSAWWVVLLEIIVHFLWYFGISVENPTTLCSQVWPRQCCEVSCGAGITSWEQGWNWCMYCSWLNDTLETLICLPCFCQKFCHSLSPTRSSRWYVIS